ncbi:MAG: aminoacyl-tRNA hydrolase [Ruminiclostridium sp.]|nr:aminoacyl-tRNA hydrolase [Ruminiclostridium sp.]MBQ8841594.1 aminoacyl-tRNA hydrolase [Ruminiclostridium sp.]
MSVLDILNKLKTEREPMVTGSVEYIICGLGNPGTQYENTRHNAGFMAIDTIAERLKTDVKKLKFKSLTADVMIGGVRCLLMKPTTFMNNSGEAVREALNFYKLSPERLIVIYDDISMDVGRTRIRKKGSDGGHNGIKSIILCTNTDTFPRIKIGVGAKPHPDYNLADWVLSPFLKEQAEALETALMNSALAAELMVQGKTDEAMNKYNK